MQPGQIEKVKNLIRTSDILTSEERAEWLALLEIMNDKQVLELERILLSHESPHSQASAPAHTITNPSGAPLHHIMNVPPSLRTDDQDSAAEAGNEEKKFSQEVRHLLEEKELPTSKPEFPLEITDRSAQNKPSPRPAGTIAAKPTFTPPIKSSVPLSSFTKPAQAPAKPIINPPSSAKTSDSRQQVAQEQNGGKEPLFHAELHSWEDIESFVKKNTAPPTTATNTPGAVFSKVLQKQTGVKPFVQTEVPELKESQVPAASSGKSLWDEKDPSLLTISIFQKADLPDLIDSLKKLIRSRGYHAVLFQLEKSLLYKIYLETGSKLLNEGNSFEKLQKESGTLGKKYMDRREFENFTDLLREIQVS